MNIIRVHGGHAIEGDVHVSGAKNSALKLMAATLLAPGTTTLTNVPNISDVHVMGKVLKGLGATIEVADEHTLIIDTSAVDSWEAPYELVAKMRASTAVMGPLLGRFNRAKIAMPGGCNLGARKIDMHILGLEALGVQFDTDHGYIHANAPEGLTGTMVSLEFASVGATENLIMAAVRAQGTTTIDNAAREPEIVDLANMLNEMGAKVSGAGTPVVTVEGVEELHPVVHQVIGDRIEAGTFIVAGALAAGDRGVAVHTAKASGRMSSSVLPSASCCLKAGVWACSSASERAAYLGSSASTCLTMGLTFFSSRSEKLPKIFSTRDIRYTSYNKIRTHTRPERHINTIYMIHQSSRGVKSARLV